MNLYRHIAAPIAITFVLFMGCVLLRVVPGAMLFPIFFAVWNPTLAAILLSFLLGLLVAYFWRRHWLSGFAMLAGILACGLLNVVPHPARSASSKAAELILVLRYYSVLYDLAEKMERDGKSPVVVAIDTDGFLSMTSGIAYDPTGEIIQPGEQRSAAWKAVTADSDLGLPDLEVHHIIGHYYSWFHY